MTIRGLRVRDLRSLIAVALALVVVAALSGCGWHGLNTLPLPGTAGGGPGSFTIQAQLPNVTNLQPNSRVRVNDVTVGNVTKVEMQGWHALLTMTLDRDVDLPANATVKLGQTSLFGSLHVELAPPTDAPPQGKLHDGSLIPLAAASTYPSTEQTLAAISLVLNGGGVGQVQDITEALSTAFAGRADDLRSLIVQLDKYVGYLNDQKDDIIAAADSLNNLVGQIAAQKPVVDKALKTIPDALAVLNDQRKTIADAITQLGRFSALTADTVNQTKARVGAGAHRRRSGAEIVGRRRAGVDPGAGRAADVSVPEGHAHQVESRRLRQPHRGHRPHVEPARLVVLHRNPVGGRPHRARNAMGTHHRATPQPLHRSESAGRALQLRSGVLACICQGESSRRWRSSPSARWSRCR